MRIVELFTFGGLAVAAHLGAWAWHAGNGAGTPAAGDEGAASVTLAAATGEMSELVGAWSKPPETTQTVEAMQPSQMVAPQAEPVALAAPMETRDRPAQPMQRPAPATPALPDDTLPQTDRQSFEPPVSHAPTASLRPQQRPEQTAPTPKPVKKPERAAPEAPKPQAKSADAKPAQKGATAQTSSGSNSGQGAGVTKQAAAATISKAQRHSLMAQWGAAIRHGIERRKRYPRGTNASGTTKLRITVSRQGRLLGMSVAQSSGDAALDRAAVEAVRRTRYPAAPGGLGQPSYSFNLPIAFQHR